jgi:hypothetical protein
MPLDAARKMSLALHRQLDLRKPCPQKYLPSATQFSELAKDKLDRLADTVIGIHLNASELIPAVTGR